MSDSIIQKIASVVLDIASTNQDILSSLTNLKLENEELKKRLTTLETKINGTI